MFSWIVYNIKKGFSFYSQLPLILIIVIGDFKPTSGMQDYTSSIYQAIRGLFSIFCNENTKACLSKFRIDRKSTRLNSSHVANSYAVFSLKKKTYQYDE